MARLMSLAVSVYSITTADDKTEAAQAVSYQLSLYHRLQSRTKAAGNSPGLGECLRTWLKRKHTRAIKNSMSNVVIEIFNMVMVSLSSADTLNR